MGDGSVSENTWETAYPVDLIESVFEVKGPGWVCDEVRRDEEPAYVEHNLHLALFGFLDESTFAGKRLLYFGCSSSSLNLARMVSDLEIVGVELLPEFVALARERAECHGASSVTFHQSPDGQSLPEGLGDFDFIVLGAVYEHLLPAERPVLLPTLWSQLNPGGSSSSISYRPATRLLRTTRVAFPGSITFRRAGHTESRSNRSAPNPAKAGNQC
jgi:2-polyprenyl-3-methyl-5-hydroxy-6-metoxy-1,4-benzoquinol methylase